MSSDKTKKIEEAVLDQTLRPAHWDEYIGQNHIKVIPEILITGGGESSPISGLLGLELLKQVQEKSAGKVTPKGLITEGDGTAKA